MMIGKKKTRVIRRSHQKEKKQVERPKYQWVFFLCVLLFFGGSLYIFLCAQFVDVVHIRVTNTHRTNAQDIERVVQDSLTGNILWCVKKSNYFFINKKQIIERIMEDQRIRNVDVKVVFPQTIDVDITEYEEFPVWCVEKNGVCYLLQEGCVSRIVDPQSDLVQKNPHFTILDHGHEQLEDQQCVLSQDDLAMISYLGKELVYAMDVRITEPYHVDLRGSREVKFFTDEGWYILADVTQTREDIINTSKLFIKQVINMEQRTNIEYVDFRFPEKIFYKLKNEEKNDMERKDDDADNEKDDAKNVKKDAEETVSTHD